MEKLNLYKDQQEIRESLIKVQDKKIQDSIKEQTEHYDNIYDMKEARRLKSKLYNEFSIFVKDTFLAEAIKGVYLPCLGSVSETTKILANNMVKEFINEKGSASSILLMREGQSYLIETLTNLIDTYHEKVMDMVDKDDPSTYTIDAKDIGEFMDELQKEDEYENVKNAIALRVANAEEEFLINNVADKNDMTDIVNQTTERINSTNADTDIDSATKSAINQESVRISKMKIDNIRHTRRRSIFEEMTRNLGTSILSNESLRESYTEDGKLNMEGIIESSRTMYAFIETVNTMKLETVDEDYIKDVLDNM